MEKFLNRGSISYQTGIANLNLITKLPEIELCKSLLKNIYLVGGCVRNAFLNIPTSDLDLATDLHPDEIIKILDKNRVPYITTGLKHGTVTILTENQIELTYFRGEKKDLRTDLSLRDFSINAMAYDLQNNQFIDYFNGFEDLENGIIKLVDNNPNIITDDPLRIIRAIRFHSQFSFFIDEFTFEQMIKFSEKLYGVAQERITVEFNKTICGTQLKTAFGYLDKIGFIQQYLPELANCIGFEQNDFHTEDVFNHILTVMERIEPELKLRLAALFHDMGKPTSFSVGEDGRRHFYQHEYIGIGICRTAMQKMKYPKDLTKEVCLLVEMHMRPTNCGAPGVRRILNKLGKEYDFWLKLKKADKPPIFSDEQVVTELENFQTMVEQERTRSNDQINGKISVSGDDLIKLGFVPGKKLGKVLEHLKALVLDDPELDIPEKLLKIAKDELEK